MTFDPRITPARGDLAAAHLKGKVEAERFVEGVIECVIGTTAPVRRAPRHDAPLYTEALYGERVTIYEMSDEGWAWGQLESDGYVGYLPSSLLAAPGGAPTHRVRALRTFGYSMPDIKTPPVVALPFGTRVSIHRVEGKFAVTERNEFIFARHIEPIGSTDPDFVATARRFLGVPYLWGGKTSLGIDCSSLVQVALQAAGIQCPRDSDMQAALGAPVSFSGDASALRRGDLICWKGHIGLVADHARLLHANEFHMMVAEEPLDEAISRIAAAGLNVIGVRRLASAA